MKPTNLSKSDAHWSTMREAGTLFGLQFLRFVHQVFGRWLVSFCLLPTVAYFVLFRPATRRSSAEFLAAHYQQYPDYWRQPPKLWDTCKHLYVFAQTVVDKLLSWCVDIDVDQFIIEHPERIEALMEDTRGQLIIGSHMGNLEYCRGFMHRYRNKTINILVHDKHSQNYNTMMQKLNPDSRLNVFQVDDFDIPTMLTIKAKIDAGEWVFIAGDRSPLSGGERTVPVEFLGKTAYLPIGPYMLAKGLGCPVKLMFSYCDYYAPDKPVHFEVVAFAERVTLDRKHREQQIQQYAQSFAQALEQQCAKAPYQWFNFYDFWAETAA
ncbi:hypothetical protein [Arenicella xantha]|nr:hypothetical protein [Arenicella xantha]